MKSQLKDEARSQGRFVAFADGMPEFEGDKCLDPNPKFDDKGNENAPSCPTQGSCSKCDEVRWPTKYDETNQNQGDEKTKEAQKIF